MVVIRNGKVYDVNNNKLIDTDVLVDGKTIKSIDKNEISKIAKDCEEVDASGCVVMPGFKNAHAHSSMTFFRSVADDLPLEAWLSDVIFPYEAKMTEEDAFYGAILAVMEYLKNGIVACQDMYFHQKKIAEAFIKTGFRAVINGSLTSAHNSDYDTEREENKSYKRVIEENEYFSSISDLISYAPGVHSTYTTSSKLMLGVAKAVKELRKGLYLHLNETAVEASTAKKKFNMTNTEYVESLGMFDFGGGIFHGVHMTDNEVGVLKKKNVGVVLNPCSNAKLTSGVADFERYKSYGVLTALGTDGASSNNSLDMFKEMWTLHATNHIKYNTIETPKPYDIVKSATVGSAKFMNLNDSQTIDKGQKADLVLIDISDVNVAPFTDFCKFLVYSANPSNVKMTMINGKVLYRDGKYNIGFDKSDIVKEVTARLNRIRNAK